MASDKKNKAAISPTREEDFTKWYQEVIRMADLAEHSPVRGCMIIKPWGYAIWENMQKELDARIKSTGHKNAYFPLFIPKSFLEKEAEHVEGFAKECAVVTHYRLIQSDSGGLELDSKAILNEPLIVRPTSETIIGHSFARWINSYRDLPLLINQWANVVRWELRPRLFTRTAEFLWQEGHTAHSSESDAAKETERMLNQYQDFAEHFLAIPVIKGVKTEKERFPGAKETYCIEAMMQDRKALQAGTSHLLGQNFSKAYKIQFQTEDGRIEHAWTTSWGVSTRLIGALIMTHSDDNGLVLPPKISPAHVVCIPIIHSEDTKQRINKYIEQLKNELENVNYYNEPIRVIVDSRDLRSGEMYWNWIKQGTPIILEIGPMEIENNTVTMTTRDKFPSKKQVYRKIDFLNEIPKLLENIQLNLLHRAKKHQKDNTVEILNEEEFKSFFSPIDKDLPEIHGGFAISPWCGNPNCEELIKDELQVTIRCIPIDFGKINKKDIQELKCVKCGQNATEKVIFAKSY